MSWVKNLNYLLVAIVLYCLVSYLLSLPAWPTGVIFAVIGSQINILLPENYKSSLLCLLPLAVATYWYPVIFIPLIVGLTSSILVMLLGKGGCRLFYPFTRTTFTGPANYLEAGSQREKSVAIFLLVLAIIAIIFSIFGTEILEDINENEGILNYYTHRENSTGYYGDGHGGNARYGENNSGYIHYVYIDTSKHAVNRNITTYNTGNNTTTTIISEYTPPSAETA